MFAPLPKLLFSRLIAELKQIINNNYFIVANNKFQLRFQALKADLPCRALCLCLKQHNGYYACSNCLQRGQVLGDRNNIVYYRYEQNQQPRTHRQFKAASHQAQLNNGQLSIEGIHGKTPLLELSFNV
ncbi:unnamed protein product [Didymodactylos carnosus]|uniref:Uncharacterized protein n=1 Tax=Didymodactylos carnosus TaxID=1234261 RepID=A0A815WK92_9BILA|nr:unnamed protein product [Didymodactylos carnosus]CAF4407212.1 unnamed protein product [Didymodactylos carnosus]